MAKHQVDLDTAFAALSDPTRRAIVSRLCQGPRSVTQLAEPFDLALPSLLKHVQVLELSGLISSHKVGRVRTCQLNPDGLRATRIWLDEHVRAWEKRLDRLEAHLEDIKRKS